MPVKAPTGARRFRWILAAALIVALVGGVIAAMMARTGAPEQVSEVAAIPPASGTQLYLDRLANQGYIPREAVDQERLLLERLVALGDIPAASLQPAREAVEPLYTAYELKLIEAVAAGHIPQETLDSEGLRLKQLANEGLIPRGVTR